MDTEHQMIWIGVTIQPIKWLDILIALTSGYVQLSTKTTQVRSQETLSHWRVCKFMISRPEAQAKFNDYDEAQGSHDEVYTDGFWMNRVGAVAIVKYHFRNDGHNLLPICQNTARQQNHICSWGCSHHSGTELLPTHGSSSSQCSSLFWLRCPVCRQLRMNTPRTVILCSLYQFLMKFYCILIIILVLCHMIRNLFILSWFFEMYGSGICILLCRNGYDVTLYIGQLQFKSFYRTADCFLVLLCWGQFVFPLPIHR